MYLDAPVSIWGVQCIYMAYGRISQGCKLEAGQFRTSSRYLESLLAPALPIHTDLTVSVGIISIYRYLNDLTGERLRRTYTHTVDLSGMMCCIY